MSDDKAKALRDDIKVEVVVNDCLNGNDAATVDITNLLDFSNAVVMETPPSTVSFGGIVGYTETHYDKSGNATSCYNQTLFTNYDLEQLERKVRQILQASIVNTKQLEALNDILSATFYQAKKDKSEYLSRIVK